MMSKREPFAGTALSSLQGNKRRYLIALLFAGILLVLMPEFVPSYLLGILTRIVILSVFAVSLNIIWDAGLTSLGHATYFGWGAYVSAILIVRLGIDNFWIILGTAIVSAIVLSAIFGVIALRVQGVYFMMVTMALSELVYFASIGLRPITGGINGIYGISMPNLGFAHLEWNKTLFYFLVLIISAICFFLMHRLHYSTFGYAMRGIRSDETKMKALGFNTWLMKYIGFIASAVFAAVAGVLFSYFLGLVCPPQVDIKTSTMAILMLIVGGSSMFFGPVLGAILIVLLEYFASIYLPTRWPLLLGLTFIFAVMFLRGGIAVYLVGLWRRNKTTEGI